VQQSVFVVAQQLFKDQMIDFCFLAPENHQRDDLDFLERDRCFGRCHGTINHYFSQRRR
jgi:hypothetical protein